MDFMIHHLKMTLGLDSTFQFVDDIKDIEEEKREKEEKENKNKKGMYYYQRCYI